MKPRLSFFMIVLVSVLFIPQISAEIVERPMDKACLPVTTNDGLFISHIATQEKLFNTGFFVLSEDYHKTPALSFIRLKALPKFDEQVLGQYSRSQRAVETCA